LNQLLELAVRGAAADPLQLLAGFARVNECVYVEDVAGAIAAACRAPALPASTYNVGSGELHDLDDALAVVARLVPGRVLRFLPPPGGFAQPVRTQPYDLSRIRADLVYVPRYDLPRGLGECLTSVPKP